MSYDVLKSLLDELFFYFEENIFENNGPWPRKVNLIFAFSDYIKSLSDRDIAEFLGNGSPKEIENFRELADKGIDTWLKANMKTLML